MKINVVKAGDSAKRASPGSRVSGVASVGAGVPCPPCVMHSKCVSTSLQTVGTSLQSVGTSWIVGTSLQTVGTSLENRLVT